MTAPSRWYAAASSNQTCFGPTPCATTVYGSYGISVFAVRGATLEEMAQQVPLVRFAKLTLMKVAAVRGAGLRLEPTGRNPHHHTLCFDDLDRGIAALAGCRHQVVPHPYHDA